MYPLNLRGLKSHDHETLHVGPLSDLDVHGSSGILIVFGRVAPQFFLFIIERVGCGIWKTERQPLTVFSTPHCVFVVFVFFFFTLCVCMYVCVCLCVYVCV